MRFKVRSLVKSFSQELTGIKEESFPAVANDILDLSAESEKKPQKELNRNNLSIACLTMELMTKDLRRKAHKVCAVEYLGGLAHLIAENLMKEH